ncbi:unnamed protein product [Lupinus luteus]|uniref:Uncharacterized protein n=1 Tax=Lupinus luteus TaxID=3873 RepID=A0AAV1YLG5_LUPLU
MVTPLPPSSTIVALVITSLALLLKCKASYPYTSIFSFGDSLAHTDTGFTDLKTCCGKGGSYNYNGSVVCGNPGVIACDDPSQHIAWDGIHLTEAAYRLIAKNIINGPYSTSI